MALQTQSKLIQSFPPYVFGRVNAEVAAARRRGEDVIYFGMGNPDGPTPQAVRDKLVEVMANKKTHGYSTSKGIPGLHKAIAKWYERRFGVSVDPATESVVTIGSKEGLAHLGLSVLNRGDHVITPNPTYPIHHYGVIIAGGRLLNIPLVTDPDRFLKTVEGAWKKSRPKPKMMILNFPHNPTTACVGPGFFEAVVDWAKRRQVLVVHDLAYADLAFGGYQAPSFLAVKGAKDVGVEFFTLSKSYNMAGWRVGFCVGNPQVVASLAKLKSYMDYGVFTPMQVAAIAALNSPDAEVRARSRVYEERIRLMVDGLNAMGWPVEMPQATMYVWAPIPPRFKKMSALDFSMMLLRETAVAVSPGTGFGSAGEGFVRFALVENKDRTRQAIRNMREFFMGSSRNGRAAGGVGKVR
jgi:alanine-synthesizing transaminase